MRASPAAGALRTTGPDPDASENRAQLSDDIVRGLPGASVLDAVRPREAICTLKFAARTIRKVLARPARRSAPTRGCAVAVAPQTKCQRQEAG